MQMVTQTVTYLGLLTTLATGTNSGIEADVNLRNGWEDRFEGLNRD